MGKKFEDSHWEVSVRAGIVEVRRDGELLGRGHWDGRRVVHPDYQLAPEEAEKLDRLVRDSLPPNAWSSADGAADELVGRMSAEDKEAVSQSGDAEAWRTEVAGDGRAQGVDHDAVLRAMYELVKHAGRARED